MNEPPKLKNKFPDVRITLEQLKKHNKENDAWLSIEGRVYNVTSYIKSHPGGKAILRGLGKDATDLFMAVHPYVNYHRLLESKQVGVLRNAPKRSNSRKSESSSKSPAAVKALVSEVSLTSVSVKKSASNFFYRKIKKKNQGSIGIPVKKFSQSDEEVKLEVYFEKLDQFVDENNWTIGLIDGRNLMIKFILDSDRLWVLRYELEHLVLEECPSIFFSENSHNLRLILKKTEPKKWNTLGKSLLGNNQFVRHSTLAPEDKNPCSITYKKQLTPNVYHFGIELESAHIGIPPGFDLKIWIGGISRFYTPFPPSLFRSMSNASFTRTSSAKEIIHLIVKIYPNGSLTPLLYKIPPKKPNALRIGQIHGMFQFDTFLADVKRVLMLSAGTGITPMLSIIKKIHTTMGHGYDTKKTTNQSQSQSQSQGQNQNQANSSSTINTSSRRVKVYLGYFNQTEKDIILKSDFETLGKDHSTWFRFSPVLTKPEKTWRGLSGHLSIKLICDILKTNEQILRSQKVAKNFKILACGPDQFNDAVKEYNLPKNFHILTNLT